MITSLGNNATIFTTDVARILYRILGFDTYVVGFFLIVIAIQIFRSIFMFFIIYLLLVIIRSITKGHQNDQNKHYISVNNLNLPLVYSQLLFNDILKH